MVSELLTGEFRALAERLERGLATESAAGDPYRSGGGDGVEQAEQWHQLGRAQWLLARYPEAARSLGRAVELRERLLGPADPLTIDSWEGLAAVHHAQREGEARSLFERVIAARRAAHGDEHPATAISLRNFGAYLRDIGAAGGRSILEQACAILAQTVGTGDPEYAAALKARAFGHCYWGAPGDWQTLELAEQAFEATARCHPEQHPFVGGALLLVGHAELAVGRSGAAERAYQAALDNLLRCYGAEHPLVAVAKAGHGPEELVILEPAPQPAPELAREPAQVPEASTKKKRKKRRRR